MTPAIQPTSTVIEFARDEHHELGVDLLRGPLYSSGIPKGPTCVGIRRGSGPSTAHNRTTAHKGHQLRPSRCSGEAVVRSVTRLVHGSFPRTSEG